MPALAGDGSATAARAGMGAGRRIPRFAPVGYRRSGIPVELVGSAGDGVRIVIAHRHELVAEALGRLLDDMGLVVVGTVCDHETLLARLPDTVAVTLLLDARLDPADGTLALLDDVRAAAPETRVVVLAEALDDALALAAEVGDLDGLVLMSDSGVALAAAVTQVAAGHAVVPAGWLSRSRRTAAANPLAQLSPRQREVLHLVAQGMDNDEIAARLFISRNTVKTHVRAIYQAIGVHNRVEAARVLAGAGAPGSLIG